ncbi:peptidase C45, partial [candidate division KSB1 bacterium]|nr:peptidase C45 [candidate division KSB1 bacterium]
MKKYTYKLRIFIIPLVLLTGMLNAREECTTAVISGAATVDGRPLLWKNRDSREGDNEVMFFRGPRYDFIGVINADDTSQVWMGLNTAGFAIMNSESMDQEGDSADTEGFFMKKVLGICGTVDELEKALQLTNDTGRGTRANFGCIDAFGGCAFFEAGNHTYTRMNADDTTLTEHGFLVRANFSMTGYQEKGYGGWRFFRALDLLTDYVTANQLDYRLMFDKVARDLVSDDVNP